MRHPVRWPRGCSYRAKDLLGLLQDGHLGPVVPLEHFDPRRVVHRGRRVRPEERGEALSEIESNFDINFVE